MPEPEVPADNPMTADKVALGRVLFYDFQLSIDGGRSCGICHEQAKGFTDGFVKAVVTLVPEVLGSPDAELDGSLKQEAEKREEVLVSLLSNLCSFLVIVPGHPEHGPFYLVTGLLNVLQAAAWRRPGAR